MSLQHITVSLFNQTPSLTPSQPCTPAPDSQESEDSLSSSHSNHTTKPRSKSLMENSTDPNSASMGFGTPIQKFTQELTKTLARFLISEKQSDKNFMRWSQPVKEAIMSLDYLL